MAALVVLDINDIDGSYPKELIIELNAKKANVGVVINKADTLPDELSLVKLKDGIFKQLNEMQPQIEGLVFLLDAKCSAFCFREKRGRDQLTHKFSYQNICANKPKS